MISILDLIQEIHYGKKWNENNDHYDARHSFA